MSFYATPQGSPRRGSRDDMSDGSFGSTSTASSRRGHRREHSDPTPGFAPGFSPNMGLNKAMSTPELLRSKTVGDPCSAIKRSCSSLAALRGLTPEQPPPPNADGFEELLEGDEFFDNFS